MDQGMHKSKDNKFIPMTSIASGIGQEVADDVFYYTDQIANVIFVGRQSDNDWVLIDTGLPMGAEKIRSVVEERFGENSKPSAILLTHGHFDHVGGLVELLEAWQVSVYAHEKEFPFLTGENKYPDPDMTVEGGLLAKISPLYPVEPINITPYLKALPPDNSVPGMPGWEWVHTPGHAPGHVSFYRKSDSLLLSGDAFITVRQDSFYKVLMQQSEINGPPRYLTTDWEAAWESVRKLESLQPKQVVPGHGPAMNGNSLRDGLGKLVQAFDQLAIPDYGKFVDNKNEKH